MLEIDEDFYPLRAIFKNEYQEHTSNFSEVENFGLPEGKCECTEADEIISENVFTKTWKSFLEKHADNWNEIQSRLSVGMEISARIKYFYTQGVILDINEPFLAILECEIKSLDRDKMYANTNQELKAKIERFDDENMWIVVTI